MPPDSPSAEIYQQVIWLCKWSIDLGAKLYPTLWAILVFRRVMRT